jgi:hypothetical protein
MRIRVFAVAAAVLGFALPAVGLAASSATKSVSTSLRGSKEVGKGSPKGRGSAVVRLDAKAGKACWTIKVKGLDKLLSSHVHKARVGKAGPVVIPLGSVFRTKGCVVGLKAKVINDILAHPARYYVNVHTKKYPNGAIRGQLHR